MRLISHIHPDRLPSLGRILSLLYTAHTSPHWLKLFTKRHHSMAIASDEDTYQPFLLDPVPGAEPTPDGLLAREQDWTRHIQLDCAKEAVKALLGERRVKVLILYGSLRSR